MARDQITSYNHEVRRLEQNIINFITSGYVQETVNLPRLGSVLTRRWILQYTMRILPIMLQDISDLGGDSFIASLTDQQFKHMLHRWIHDELVILGSNGGLVPEWTEEHHMAVLVHKIIDELENLIGDLYDPIDEPRVLGLNEETMLKFMQIRSCGSDDEETSDEICVVCQDVLFRKNEEIATLKCGQEHEYHYGCIKQWLQGNNICPLCRVQLLETSIN